MTDISSNKESSPDPWASDPPVELKLNEEQTAAFVDALENPPPANESLRERMRKRPPWAS